jgi:putative oxidoreductase
MSTTAYQDIAPSDSIATVWAPRVLAVLRIVVALLFIEHGTQKLFSFPAPPPFPNPAAFTMLWCAAVLEMVGGLAILLGFLTRPVAFILSGEMAVAYFMGHFPHGFFPALNGGDAAVLFSFVFLYLAAAGPGEWSLDGIRRQHGA